MMCGKFLWYKWSLKTQVHPIKTSVVKIHCQVLSCGLSHMITHTCRANKHDQHMLLCYAAVLTKLICYAWNYAHDLKHE